MWLFEWDHSLGTEQREEGGVGLHLPWLMYVCELSIPVSLVLMLSGFSGENE